MGSQHSNIILLSFTLKLPGACRPSSPGWGEHPPGSKGLPRAEGEGGPDNHDGVISHLEPDILECEVIWALGSITTNKASGGDGIPVELFQILKDDVGESEALNLPANLENSAVATGLEKVCFHSNPKERQCQRMFKLLHNFTHLTCKQSNAQNSPSKASTVHEP